MKKISGQAGETVDMAAIGSAAASTGFQQLKPQLIGAHRRREGGRLAGLSPWQAATAQFRSLHAAGRDGKPTLAAQRCARCAKQACSAPRTRWETDTIVPPNKRPDIDEYPASNLPPLRHRFSTQSSTRSTCGFAGSTAAPCWRNMPAVGASFTIQIERTLIRQLRGA